MHSLLNKFNKWQVTAAVATLVTECINLFFNMMWTELQPTLLHIYNNFSECDIYYFSLRRHGILK